MKKSAMLRKTCRSAFQQQRGVALFVVIIFVMLSMLLALWATRTSIFNEMVVGNDADYQRAYEAAQALLQDAELDIRGENSDGTSCIGEADVCRKTTAAKIPLETQEIAPLLSSVASMCSQGLCSKRDGKQDFWNNSDEKLGLTLAQMAKAGVGARYGQYTGASLGSTSKPANPILADTSAANRGGWYWIEVLPYLDTKNMGLITDNPKNFLALNLKPNIVYRITTLAYGRKPNTMVVLQQTYAQQKRKD
ncbi:pilus assembly PilX family protein [Delftia sp. NA_296.1]|uniref:pilus assembly PilX family protein n=1 Tax=Delftia TaxID=80865 RepID=UPI003341DBC4